MSDTFRNRVSFVSSVVEDFKFGGAEFPISEAPLNKYVIKESIVEARVDHIMIMTKSELTASSVINWLS